MKLVFATHNLNKFKEVAKANDIKIQHTVGSYGNDTMSFFLENTPTAILDNGAINLEES